MEENDVGLVPRIAKPGDLVSIIHGSNFPCVLRPVDCGYRFTGHCYVDGIMHGEAVY